MLREEGSHVSQPPMHEKNLWETGSTRDFLSNPVSLLTLISEWLGNLELLFYKRTTHNFLAKLKLFPRGFSRFGISYTSGVRCLGVWCRRERRSHLARLSSKGKVIDP